MVWWRHQLGSDTLTQEETKELKKHAANKIDAVNNKLGLEKVARDEGGVRVQIGEGCVNIFNAYVKNKTADSVKLGMPGKISTEKRSSLLNHHLHLRLDEAVSGQWLDDTVLYCQLYSERKPGFVSERWCVPLIRKGPQTVFIDLGSLDQCLDLHLVVQVFRIGKIVQPETQKTQESSNRRSHSGRSLTGQVGPLHKRPVSAGVSPVGHLFHSDRHNSENLQRSDIELKLHACDEKDFHQLHELILRNSGKSSFATVGPSNIKFQLSVFSGLIEDIRDQNPLIFKELSETRKLGFPPVVMPGDIRNDLFLTLERGQFEKGKPSISARNIEVKIGVFDKSGSEIVNSIIPASGGGPVFPAIYYHNNSPSWGETFRAEVAIDQFQAEGCHLRLEYRHCSVKEKQEKKLIGFSWIELMQPDGTAIMDNPNELPVYKCDAPERLNPGLYLKTTPDQADTFHRSPKESVTISTLLCSTKLTQNVDLMSLLNWRATPDRIPDILGCIMKTGGEEIVKFLQDVLDVLFSMFSTEDGNSTPHSGLVFHVLVHILAILQEPKYENFQPVIDAYIRDHFAAALVYKGLLSCVKHCADMVPSTERQDPIRKCFQSLSQVFRLIVASRQLFARATGGQNEDSFQMEVHLLFNSFNKMLSYQTELVLPTQIVFLNNMSCVYPSLLQVMPVIDMAKLTTLTLDSLGSERNKLLHKAALSAVRAAINSQLWQDPASRRLLLPSCLEHVIHHLQIREEIHTATSIILEIIQTLKDDKARSKLSPFFREASTLAEKCIGPLGIAIVAEQELSDDPDNLKPASLIAALMGILELLSHEHHSHIWREDSGLLGRLFTVLSEIVSKPAFPSEWMSLSLAVAVTLSSTIQLTGNCLPELTFDKQLWMAFFRLSVSYITSPIVQIEIMKKQGRFCIGMDTVGDLRLTIAVQMVETWKKCPEQIQLVPSLVGPLLELTLIPVREIRQTILPLLISMMDAEQRVKGNFKQMETELIDKLDILISENKGDNEYHQIFNSLMLDLVQHLDPTWRDMGKVFVSSVSRLLERLLDYRDVLQGEKNRNKRMSCTVNLLKFYRDDVNRQEMYIRYIYKLHDLHIPILNHVEAAFTLQLHASQLEWTTRMLHADLQFPTQQEWQRKEQLYGQIIDLFDRSKLWEYAVPLCKDLCDLYEHRIYDFNKLSDVLRKQAAFYQKILSEFRPEPEYFRVGFFGSSYPLFVRNKEFIYRGLDYEKISDFTQRLSTEFPEATLCSQNTPSEEELIQQEEQFLQICSVKPLKEETAVYLGPTVPDRIKAFYSVNRVSSFVSDRPFHQGTPDTENEFTTLWIERTTYKSSSEFPGILKWFDVVNKEVTLVHPVQFACETVVIKNAELQRFIREYSADRHKNISPFTMRLQGNIDAAVNGGVAKYKNAFFTPEFSTVNPNEQNSVECLAGYLEEQARLLEEALDLHGQLAPEPVQPLHDRLLHLFAQMKTGMQKSHLLSSPGKPRTSSIINTPLPPVPGHSSTTKLERKDSGFSLTSHSLYGKFSGEDLDEDIYCKPPGFGLDIDNSYHDISATIADTYTDNDDTNTSNTQDGKTSYLDGSYQYLYPVQQSKQKASAKHDYMWMEGRKEAIYSNKGIHRQAPPLPPRGSSNRNSTTDSIPSPLSPLKIPSPLASPISSEQTDLTSSIPPALPRRPSKKSPRQSTSCLSDIVFLPSDHSSLAGSTDSPPPLINDCRPTSPNAPYSSPPPLHQRTSSHKRPPPIPPRVLTTQDSIPDVVKN
eukprot:GFUD01009995.1.p1 GENE.GFUD01009995.1~~GFUD01009995.1.p1  ORF type:complete len:1824 (+),score=321.37 GFUD01009995.1:199-5472(+)